MALEIARIHWNEVLKETRQNRIEFTQRWLDIIEQAAGPTARRAHVDNDASKVAPELAQQVEDHSDRARHSGKPSVDLVVGWHGRTLLHFALGVNPGGPDVTAAHGSNDASS